MRRAVLAARRAERVLLVASPPTPGGAEDAQLLETVPGAPENPDERIALEQALRALPPDQREVVH